MSQYMDDLWFAITGVGMAVALGAVFVKQWYKDARKWALITLGAAGLMFVAALIRTTIIWREDTAIHEELRMIVLPVIVIVSTITFAGLMTILKSEFERLRRPAGWALGTVASMLVALWGAITWESLTWPPT